MLLTWQLPEAPNGVILYYRLFRDSVNFANTSSGLVLNHTDIGLTPNTIYLYAVESVNIAGSAKSVALSVRTQEAPPVGVASPVLVAVNSTAVNATWQVPSQPNGNIQRYELSVAAVNQVPTILFSGSALAATVTGLMPFTLYRFTVNACTAGGCGSSPVASVQTPEDAPLSQPTPTVTAINSTALRISWSSPAQPNGVITMYSVFQREAPFVSSGVVVGNTTGSVLSLVVEGLLPFTEHEFSIVSHTSAGSTQSEWGRGRTLESGECI